MNIVHHFYEPSIEAINCKRHALLLTGNIFDLHVEKENESLFFRPLYIAEKLHENGFIVARYSRSAGFSVHRYNELTENKTILQNALNKCGLQTFLGRNEISPTEVIEIFRGIKTLMTTKFEKPFAIVVDYLPHLSACQSPSIEERIVSETLNDCASLPSVLKNGNIILAFAHEETSLSPLIKGFYQINYSYPKVEEYETFFKILKKRNDEFAATDITPQECAKISSGLKLSDLAGLFRAHKEMDRSVDKGILIHEKERLIERLSDRTLKVLSTEIGFDDLAGLEVPKKVLQGFAEKLAKEDKTSPRAILLAGPPGTGKTTITSAFANACGFNLVSFAETKSKWVGESESRLAKALELIEALSPVILFIDEIDQQFKNRSESSLDGGVSQHYLSELFKFAARDELRGKVCIVGCSNTPQLLDPAMIDRFTTIPILEATPKELAVIFPKIEKRIGNKETIQANDPLILKACTLIYEKGASPRQVFEIINHTISKYGENYSSQQILKSCQGFRSSANPANSAYSSLSSLSLTSFDDYFPWAGNYVDYPFPWYLENVVNKNDGSINEQELNKQLNALKSKASF